jgi:phosphoketolase
MEALAATAMPAAAFPELKVRFVNVVDLLRLVPNTEHPHGLTDKEFDALFTTNNPIIFNFHVYPWLTGLRGVDTRADSRGGARLADFPGWMPWR